MCASQTKSSSRLAGSRVLTTSEVSFLYLIDSLDSPASLNSSVWRSMNTARASSQWKVPEWVPMTCGQSGDSTPKVILPTFVDFILLAAGEVDMNLGERVRLLKSLFIYRC